MKKMHKRRGLLWAILVIIFGFFPFVWKRGNLLLVGADFMPPLYPGEEFLTHIYAWEGLSGGQAMVQHLPMLFPYRLFFLVGHCLGISLPIVELAWFSFIYVLAGLSMFYFLYKVVFGGHHGSLAFIGALCYMYTPYSCFLLPPGHILQLLPMAIFPLILGLLIQALRADKGYSKYVIALSLATLLMATANANPGQLLIIVGLVIVYFIFYLVSEGLKSLSRITKITLLAGVLTIVVNAWWLFPFLKSLPSIATSQLTESSLGRNLMWLRISSKHSSILELFRVLGDRVIYEGNSPYPFAGFYLANPFGILLTFIIPLVAFAGLLGKKRKSLLSLYCATILLLGIWLSKGVHGPLGGIFEWLFTHIPLMSLFRRPVAKFAWMISFGYATLLSLALFQLFTYIEQQHRRYSRYTLTVWSMGWIATTLTVIAIGYPLWSGRVWGDCNFLKIPNYYYDAKKWIDNQSIHPRSIILPSINSASPTYIWGYQGVDAGSVVLQRNIIIANSYTFASRASKLVGNLARSDLSVMMRLFSAKYVILQGDIDWKITGAISPRQMADILKQYGFILYRNFGLLSIYKLPISDNYFLPHIYPSITPIVVDGDIEVLMPMTETKYLGGKWETGNGKWDKPVLLFTEQMQKGDIRGMGNWGQETGILGDWGRNINFVFKDGSWRDLAVELSAQSTVHSPQSTVRIETPGIYEIYFEKGKGKRERVKGEEWEIEVDGKEIAILGDWGIRRLGTGDWETGGLGRKYLKMGEVELREGEHEIKLKMKNEKLKMEKQNIKLVLVDKKEREEAEKLIWKRINSPETEVCYIFEK